MHRGRRKRRMVGGREEDVSLGVIMTNTEIFHIFNSISLFNLPYFKTFHSSTWVSSIFSLSFHNFLLYFPNLITIQLGFVPYFSYHFTIQLGFLPYFSYLFPIQLTFLPYFPDLFIIQLTFLLYFPNLFTIQLTFLRFLLTHLHNSLNDILNIIKF